MKNPSILIIWPVLVAGFLAHPNPATAQTEYWDPGNTGGTGSGGPGAWSTGTPWFNGTMDVAWPSGGSAFFEGAAGGSVTLSTGVTVDGLTFTTTGYTFSGSTITLAGTPIITVPSGGTETISSILAGTVPWMESGSGTLILGGVNTFSSNMTISAGSILTIGGAGQLAGGTYTNNMTNNGSFIYNSTAAQTIGGSGNGFGVLSGTGTVTQNGPGTLTFAGNRNSYTGGTIINAGIVSFGGDSTSGVGNLGEVPTTFVANNIVLGGGTLYANNNVTLAANRGIQLTANSTLDVASAHTMTIGGIISQSGGNFGLTTTPTGGILQFSNANTYSGTTVVSAGTLEGLVAGSIPGTLNVSSSGTLTLSNAAAMSADAVFYLPASPNNGQVNLNFTGTQNISSFIVGSFVEPVGTYTASGQGGTVYAGPVFTGTGILNVTGLSLTYWDPGNTGGTGSGGNGSWDNSTSDWFTGSPASDTTWPTNTFANFAGMAGTVMLNASLSADGLAFTTTGYTISEGSGSPILTLTGAPVISVPSGTTAVNCTLAGTGGLTENGSGTLSLGGVDTYTGGTTVSAGSALTIGGAGQLGSGAYAGNVTNAGTFTDNSSAPQTLSGVISGAGTLTQSGSGTLTLSGVNTYTNTTSISSGSILTIGGAGTLPAANIITDNGSLIYNSSTALTNSAVISGTGTVTQSGPATLTFSGGNKTYTGGITINAGIVSIGGDSAAGAAANLGEVPTSFVFNNIVLHGGTLSANNNVALNANRGILLTANSGLDVGTQQSAHQLMTIAGVISQSGGSFGITKTSAGILGLTNVNTYTGTTTVSAGTLDGDVAGSIPASVIINTGGALTLSNASAMSADGALTLPATPSAGQVNLDFSGTQYVSGLIVGSTAQAAGVYSSSSTLGGVSGVITGTGTLTVTGLGVTYWDPGNTGGTGSGGNGNWDASSTADWFNGSADTTWPTGTFANFAGPAGIVMLNASVNADGLAFATTGYTISEGSGSPILTLTGAPVISVPSGAAAVNCTLAGTAGLTESGAGTLSLGGVDAYTGGTTVSAGSALTIGGAGQLGSGAYAGNITNAGTFTDNSSAPQTLSGVISGAGVLNQSGAGTLTLSGINTYTNTTTISSGSTLTIGGAGTLPAANNITDDGSYIYNSSAPQTISGIVSGTGTVTEIGSGTLTLTGGHNTYTGGTIINSGTISIGGDGASNGAPANLGTVPTSFVANNIVLAGGTLSANNGVTLLAHRGIQLTANSGLDAASGHTLAVEGVISQSGGSFGIMKTSAGILELIGVNIYTGTTTISEGTLDIYTSGSIAGNITVGSSCTNELDNASAMSSGATLTLPASPSIGQVYLNFSGTQTISALNFGSTSMATGTWGATGTSATHQNATFTGAGILNITSGGTAQTITFPNPGTQTYGVAPITLTATAPGGTVTYTVTSGPASVAGSTLTITGAGSVTVQANQAGTTTIDAAPPVNDTFTVNPLAITLTGTEAYTGIATAPGSVLTVTDAINGDNPTVNPSGFVDLTGSTAGTWSIINDANLATLNPLTGAGAANYTVTGATGSVTITGGVVTNTPPFLITNTSIQVIGGVSNLVVCFQTVSNNVYNILTNGNLTLGETNIAPWVDVGGLSTPASPVTATNSSTCVDIPIGSGGTNVFVLVKQSP